MILSDGNRRTRRWRGIGDARIESGSCDSSAPHREASCDNSSVSQFQRPTRARRLDLWLENETRRQLERPLHRDLGLNSRLESLGPGTLEVRSERRRLLGHDGGHDRRNRSAPNRHSLDLRPLRRVRGSAVPTAGIDLNGADGDGVAQIQLDRHIVILDRARGGSQLRGGLWLFHLGH